MGVYDEHMASKSKSENQESDLSPKARELYNILDIFYKHAGIVRSEESIRNEAIQFAERTWSKLFAGMEAEYKMGNPQAVYDEHMASKSKSENQESDLSPKARELYNILDIFY